MDSDPSPVYRDSQSSLVVTSREKVVTTSEEAEKVPRTRYCKSYFDAILSVPILKLFSSRRSRDQFHRRALRELFGNYLGLFESYKDVGHGALQ